MLGWLVKEELGSGVDWSKSLIDLPIETNFMEAALWKTTSESITALLKFSSLISLSAAYVLSSLESLFREFAASRKISAPCIGSCLGFSGLFWVSGVVSFEPFGIFV